jgi:hypothetical protein
MKKGDGKKKGDGLGFFWFREKGIYMVFDGIKLFFAKNGTHQSGPVSMMSIRCRLPDD